MATFKIPSFKFGLDTRREQLTSNAGTLLTASNVVVNEGGELAKRPAIELIAGFGELDTMSLFGFLPGVFIGSVFYVFGSGLPHSVGVTQGQPVSGPLLTGLLSSTYQQLKHPSIANDSAITYVDSRHRMTSLIFADSFDGKTIALGGFADGGKYLYYDGALVQQSINGLLMTDRLTLADLGDDLLRQLQAFGWLGDANVDTDGSAQDGSVMVKSPVSDYYATSVVETSVSGFIGDRFYLADQVSTAAVKAMASFQVTVNTGPFVLTAPANADGTGTVNLCGGDVSAAGTTAETATKIATLVNELTYFHGYTALTSISDSVFIYAPQGFDVSPNPDIVLTVTPDASVSVTAVTGPSGFDAVISPNPSVGVRTVNISADVSLPATVTTRAAVFAIGGSGTTPVYTYLWSEVGEPSGILIASDITSGSITFRHFFDVTRGQQGILTGRFQCIVTNFGSSPKTVFVTVSLQLINLAAPI